MSLIQDQSVLKKSKLQKVEMYKEKLRKEEEKRRKEEEERLDKL